MLPAMSATPPGQTVAGWLHATPQRCCTLELSRRRFVGRRHSGEQDQFPLYSGRSTASIHCERSAMHRSARLYALVVAGNGSGW